MLQEIPYKIVRSDRQSVALQISRDAQVMLRCPEWLNDEQAENIVKSKRTWILKQLKQIKKPDKPDFTGNEIEEMKTGASETLRPRAEYFAGLIGVHYNKLSVRLQRSLWGSCSSRGNLSFNCLLMLVPPEIQDYVVVHELCHLKEMNHSGAFWKLVEKTLPDYERRRQWLKDKGRELILRIPDNI